jgi:hypothetical protein
MEVITEIDLSLGNRMLNEEIKWEFHCIHSHEKLKFQKTRNFSRTNLP